MPKRDEPRITRIEAPPGRLLGAINQVPITIFRLRLGRLFGGRFARIVHRGRKTGAHRTVIVETADGSRTSGRVVFICAYGSRAQWYRNLQESPAVSIEIGGEKYMSPRHEFLDREETEQAIASYWRRYPRMAALLARNGVFFYPGPVADEPGAPTSLAFYLE